MTPEHESLFAVEIEKHWNHFAEKWIAWGVSREMNAELRMAFVAGWGAALLRLNELGSPTDLAYVVENLARHADRQLQAESKACEARWPEKDRAAAEARLSKRRRPRRG